VSLDRIDLRELRPDSLREHVSLARGIDVFQGTLQENVHLNRPHINASDVREALERVLLLDELMQLHDGLNSHVQTGGPPLSDSQSWRLMLARAIANRPRLLLIDGVLDKLSDDLIQAILPNLSSPGLPWTLIIATGRREVAESCHAVFDFRTRTKQICNRAVFADVIPNGRS
jgi:ABC-type bacteriocin/lantibiotic exporter with double-glycine peptidase domain